MDTQCKGEQVNVSDPARKIVKVAEAWRVRRALLAEQARWCSTAEGRRRALRRWATEQTEFYLALRALGVSDPRNVDGMWSELECFGPIQRAKGLLLLGPYLAVTKAIEIVRRSAPAVTPDPATAAALQKCNEILDAGLPSATSRADTDVLVDRCLALLPRRSMTPEEIDCRFNPGVQAAIEYLAGPWLEEWCLRCVREEHQELKMLAVVLVSGAVFRDVRLWPSQCGELGATPRSELAERLPGAVIEALEGSGNGDWGRFLSEAVAHAVPRPSENEILAEDVLGEGVFAESVEQEIATDPALQLAVSEELESVRQWLESLPAEERESMRLLAEGLEPSKIAEVLGKGPEAVRNSIWRARKKLRRSVGGG